MTAPGAENYRLRFRWDDASQQWSESLAQVLPTSIRKQGLVIRVRHRTMEWRDSRALMERSEKIIHEGKGSSLPTFSTSELAVKADLLNRVRGEGQGQGKGQTIASTRLDVGR